METLPDDLMLWKDLEEYHALLGDYENARECRNKVLEIRAIQ